MLAVSHVALQIGLCGAVAKIPASASIPIRVRLSYRIGEPEFDKTFTISVADGSPAFYEFDVRPGQYRLRLDSPKLDCSAAQFVDVLPERNRKVVVTMVEGKTPTARPQLLMEGTAPLSFLYTKPTYVLIDRAIACNAPIVAPVAAPIDYAYDQGAYYLAMFAEPGLAGSAPTVALRLRTPTGLAHYVRVPVVYADIGVGWPGNVRFDMSEDMIAGLATEKTDTLLCPKLWSTHV